MKRWHVSDAYKKGRAGPVGAFGTVKDDHQNMRAEVETALLSAGKPVV